MEYDRSLSFEYFSPTKIIYGENSINEVGLEMDSLGCTRALVVTDMGIVDAGLAERVIKALGKRYIGTYDRCIQDSGFHLVNEGSALGLEYGADILISVGGGSVIDTAKGMAMVMKEGGKLEDHAGAQKLTRSQTPHIVIPTTAGTGSEVTRYAVIKDWDRNIKDFIFDYHIIPDKAILDPTMTAGLPPILTAGTGMDAFTHALEAIHTMERQPLADAMALHAIKLIVQYLPQCIEDGSNLFARGQQLLAATIAGIACSTAFFGLNHAMAHCLGALFEVPHGIANSILLPHVMNFNMDECADLYAGIARAMGVDTRDMNSSEAGMAAAKEVKKLTQKIGLPQSLREVGVPEEGLAEAAELSLSDGNIIYNPRVVTGAEEVLEVYKAAW
ncbi:MAG: iron-containing alcohol dehydrogenase [Bacillota bacterium]|nr:iron-containing alcohol dehydrogenase [Bacillota bacterium]